MVCQACHFERSRPSVLLKKHTHTHTQIEDLAESGWQKTRKQFNTKHSLKMMSDIYGENCRAAVLRAGIVIFPFKDHTVVLNTDT